jgi:hypothetical protein
MILILSQGEWDGAHTDRLDMRDPLASAIWDADLVAIPDATHFQIMKNRLNQTRGLVTRTQFIELVRLHSTIIKTK